MDTDLADMMAALARIDERQGHIIEKIDNLEQVAMKRLNSHARDIDSLQQTRDRQRGAAKLAGVLVVTLGAVLGWFKWWS